MKILAKMVATVLGVQALVSVDAALASQYVTNGGFESSSYTSSQVFFGANTPATDWTSGGSWVIFCTAANTRCDDSRPVWVSCAAGAPQSSGRKFHGL